MKNILNNMNTNLVKHKFYVNKTKIVEKRLKN